MDELRKLQLVELDILRHVSTFCRRNNIRYSLCGGTLLGAVRHKGFIPWDDDLDICMLRSDYERFLSLWVNEPHDGYIVQNKESNRDFTQSFTKVRKDNTAFVQECDVGKDYHKGIFIDIFPIDRIPNGFQRAIFKAAVMIYQLCCRECSPPASKSNCLQRLISKVFLMFTNRTIRMCVRSVLLRYLKYFNSRPELGLVSIATVANLSYVFPADIADNFIEVDFEESRFLVWEKWDSALTILYGDYLTLPPENERTWPHRPLLLDFNKND